MTIDIDRTIEKLKLVVEKMKVVGDSNYWTMKEHEQLAEWLEELKTTRIALEKANGCLEANWKLGYQKAIDNMVCSLIKNSTTEEIDGKICLIVTEKRIKIVAEQLKEGGTDEMET